jgi:ketosteroid isomerase-like protein
LLSQQTLSAGALKACFPDVWLAPARRKFSGEQTMLTTTKTKHAQLAADFMQAFREHKTDAILKLMSPNPVWEFAVGPDPHGVIHSGQAAVRQAIENTWKNFPDIYYTDLRIYDAGESVIYEVLTESKEKTLRVQSVDIMTFDANDKIATKRTYRKVVTK